MNSRNGSGSVSISEFCFLLRLVVGTKFDRRVIFKAMAVMDGNRDRNISIVEFSFFIYRIWKSQLARCASQLSALSNTQTNDSEVDKIFREKSDLKEAIKRNFPRAWRDLAEEAGHTVNGPFSTLLTHLGLDVCNRKDRQADLTNVTTFSLSQSAQSYGVNGDRDSDRDRDRKGVGERERDRVREGHGEGEGVVEGEGDYHSERCWSAGDSPALFSTPQHGSVLPALPHPSQPSHSNRGSRTHTALERPLSASTFSSSTATNGLLRFKIKVNRIPGGPVPVSLHTPQRAGHALTLPVVRNMNEESNLSRTNAPSFYRGY